MVEKPFISPDPDSHLTCPVYRHHLFKGSSLAKATEEIPLLTFLCSSNHGTHQHRSQIRRAITQHSQKPAGCSSVKHTLKLMWFQRRYLYCKCKRAIFTYMGIEEKVVHQPILVAWGRKARLDVWVLFFSSLSDFLWVPGKLFMPSLTGTAGRLKQGWVALVLVLLGFPGFCEQDPWVTYVGIESQGDFFLGVFEDTFQWNTCKSQLLNKKKPKPTNK